MRIRCFHARLPDAEFKRRNIMKKITSIIAILVLGTSALFAREITISVGAGENWKGRHSPQFAVWLEDMEGNYIKTLYVTAKASKKSWIFAPKRGRPESLPVWYHASKQDTRKGKEAQKANNFLGLDAVTSATPKGGIIFNQEIEDTDCIIKAEFNVSFDYNNFYTKKNSSDNGQPSLVYQAEIRKGESEEVKLTFAGSGSLDGSDGLIHRDTEGITTASSIVKITRVTFPQE